MYEIKVTVNGEEIPLSDFPAEIIAKVLAAMLETLKGVEEIKSAVVEIKQ